MKYPSKVQAQMDFSASGGRAAGMSDRWLDLIQVPAKESFGGEVALPTSLRAPLRCHLVVCPGSVIAVAVQKESRGCLAVAGHSLRWRTHLSPYCQPSSILDTTGMTMVTTRWVANVSGLWLEMLASLFSIHFCSNVMDKESQRQRCLNR